MSDSARLPQALRRPESIPLADKPVWSLADASKATTLSTRTLQKLIASGKLPARKVGRRVLLDPAAVKSALLG
ncbi:MAG: helix-turn-helix domain-containing protein [Planctomycetaceae bacterium]|nr:helix-turn-helix domain-containing protein [Planctomycetaceae bacterium]